MTKIRSEYIKKLMTENNNLEDKLKSVANSTILSILEDKTNKNLRKFLSEDKEEEDDSFSEEEVENTNKSEEEPESEEKEGEQEDNKNDEDCCDWDELEKYKDEDGEYDLRSMDKEELMKVLKSMSPDDSVRIVKNEDDTLTVEDEDEEEEFILDLGDDEDDNDSDNIEFEIDDSDVEGSDDDELDFEIEVSDDDEGEDDDEEDEFEIVLDETDLGYTDNYLKSRYMEKGKKPSKKEVNYPYDECGEEQCLDEAGGEFGMAVARSTSKQHRNNSGKNGGQPYGSRHNSVGGEYKENSEEVIESIKKKANEIFLENKELKKLMETFKQRVNEAIVVNQSLANVIKLINENSTTSNEKKEILKRFNECSTMEESNKLYGVISEELKRNVVPHTDVNKTINSQLSEGRNRAIETPMYKSEDLSETLNFMERLNAIK